jgi:hypothetical protein
MAICDTCANEYDKAFTVTRADGHTATFDSIECARSDWRRRAHCGCRILGHGVEADDKIYCCDLLLRELRPQSRQHRRQRPLSRSGRCVVMKTATTSLGSGSAGRPQIGGGRAVQSPGLADAFRPLIGGIYGPAPGATELGSFETTAQRGSAR